MGLIFFSSHQQSNVENVERYLKTWLKIYLYSGVKCNLGKHDLRPSVNLWCDYEIVFTIASKLPKMGVVSWQMPFIHVLFLNCRFSNKNVFRIHANAQASLGNVIVIYFLFESYRGTWVLTSKSKKSRSASNQVGNAFQALFFNDFARDSQNSGKSLRAASFYTF